MPIPDDFQHARARAERFNLQLGLRYRAQGETAWFEGRTENVSYSGVLFWTQQVMDVNTGVEMSFEMPVEFGKRRAQIVCRGKIVRVVSPASPDDRPGLAARILAYRFVRGKRKFSS